MIDEKLYEVIRGRRSIRRFDLARPVEKEKIHMVLEAANWAPSACNVQGWHFIVIDDRELQEQLVFKGLDKIKETPVAIFVFYRKFAHTKPVNMYLDDHVQSASAAIQNMLLMAHNLSLGAVWINGIDQPMSKFVKIPYGYEFIALIRMGYPQHQNQAIQVRKYSYEDIVSYNSLELPRAGLIRRRQVWGDYARAWLKRITVARKLYQALPKKIQTVFATNKDTSSFKCN